jgi:hypothetical protein
MADEERRSRIPASWKPGRGATPIGESASDQPPTAEDLVKALAKHHQIPEEAARRLASGEIVVVVGK